MNEFRADLHCHSTCSDGTFSPEELILHALEKGLTGLSITDHDSIQAYSTALAFAKEQQLALLSGVEFSTMFNEHSIHILGYSFSVDHPAILEFCEKHQQRRLQRNRLILQKLKENGMPLEESDLEHSSFQAGKQTIGRPHIALALLKKGYVSTFQEAFHLHIGEGKPSFVAGSSFSTEETIAIIHQANGYAVLAHPHLIEPQRLIKKLLELPFDGLEGYYARFAPQEQKRWVKIAQARNWLITGGSDFHGTIKPNNPLGGSWVRDDIFKLLYDRFLLNSSHSGSFL